MRDDETQWALVEQGVADLLAMVGEDPAREGLVETPARVRRAYLEMTQGYSQDPSQILSKQFDIEHNCDQVVILRDISFVSLCEHHLLPFTGLADVGYLPNERVVGLSKLARLTLCYAQRLQLQERLTHQIADALMNHVSARGAAVVIRARHSCMGCRGVRDAQAEMVTSAMLGRFRESEALRNEFMQALR